MTRCPLWVHRTFILLSSRERHSRASHRVFSITSPFCRCYWDQNRLFWGLHCHLRVYSMAWGLGVRLQSYGCTRFLKLADGRGWLPTFLECVYYRRYGWRALLFPCIPWRVGVGEESIWFRRVGRCGDAESVSGCESIGILVRHRPLPRFCFSRGSWWRPVGLWAYESLTLPFQKCLRLWFFLYYAGCTDNVVAELLGRTDVWFSSHLI